MLIFHRFPSPEAAAMFAGRVERDYPGHGVHIHADTHQAMVCDPFPFDLAGPVVHVGRADLSLDNDIERARENGFANDEMSGAEIEAAIAELVKDYGGTFAGT
jgi:hypothetical protein